MQKALVLVAVLGCSSSKKGDSDHFRDFKPEAMKIALQGAWVAPDTANLVDKAAYEITGDQVKKVNAKGEEETFKLVIDNPCQFGLAKPDGSTYHMGAMLKDGTLTWTGDDAGYRKGDYAIMCAGLTTWTVENGKCWEKGLSDRWKEEAGKCGFKQKDGGEVFFWTWAGKENTAEMDGDTLKFDKERAGQKVADLAAARAALAREQ